MKRTIHRFGSNPNGFIPAEISRVTVLMRCQGQSHRLRNGALEMAVALQRFRDNYFALGPFPGDRIWSDIVTDCFKALALATGDNTESSGGRR
jgi:hypothetical protein